MTSQNALYRSACFPDDEEDGGPGAALARYLASSLRARGWRADEPEIWRDSGWSLRIERASSILEVVVARLGTGECLIGVWPWDSPGVLGRLLGRRASARELDCYDLAQAVHELLVERDKRSEILWRSDGFPDPSDASPTPCRPCDPSAAHGRAR